MGPKTPNTPGRGFIWPGGQRDDSGDKSLCVPERSTAIYHPANSKPKPKRKVLLRHVDVDVVAYEEVYQSNVIARIDDGTVIVLAEEGAQQVNKRTTHLYVTNTNYDSTWRRTVHHENHRGPDRRQVPSTNSTGLYNTQMYAYSTPGC